MKTERILIIILVVAAIIWSILRFYSSPEKIVVLTDKKEYRPNDTLKVTIKNDFGKKICFSSCYPYYLERKDGKWESYQYVDCYDFDYNGHCIEARQEKIFELTLPKIKEGLHRLALPICVGCENTEEFKEDKRFYSNEFIVQ